jgi:hypothetical protein
MEPFDGGELTRRALGLSAEIVCVFELAKERNRIFDAVDAEIERSDIDCGELDSRLFTGGKRASAAQGEERLFVIGLAAESKREGQKQQRALHRMFQR